MSSLDEIPEFPPETLPQTAALLLDENLKQIGSGYAAVQPGEAGAVFFPQRMAAGAPEPLPGHSLRIDTQDYRIAVVRPCAAGGADWHMELARPIAGAS